MDKVRNFFLRLSLLTIYKPFIRPRLNDNNVNFDKGVNIYHVTCAFPSKSTLFSCLNVKEVLTQNKRDISSLSDSNKI